MPRPEKSDIEQFLSQVGSARAGERALTGALVGGALPIGFAAAKGVVSPLPFKHHCPDQSRRLGASSSRAGMVESGEAPDEIAGALHWQ